MTVEQNHNIVLITVTRREIGHDLVRQVIQRRTQALLNQGGRLRNAVLQADTSTLDQTIGVEQQGRTRRHRHAGFRTRPAQSQPEGDGVGRIKHVATTVGVHHDGWRMPCTGVHQFAVGGIEHRHTAVVP